MLLNILSLVLLFTFLTLGAIHFYWAFGGEWAIKNAIPTKIENENSGFRPPASATLLVGIVLIIFACFYFFQTNFIVLELPKWTYYFLWILPTLFLIRAIGDFKYVGFFKSIKTTLFSKWDTNLYSPLCLAITVVGFIIYFLLEL